MDIVRLRYFVTVAKTLNVTKAAQLLNVSPPAISKGIKTLETELDVELLIKNSRSMNLSPAGEILFKEGSALLDSIESLKSRLNGMANEINPFRIGTFCEFSSYFSGYLTSQEASLAADVYDFILPGEMEKALLDQTIDLAISLVPMPHPNIEYLKVCTIEHAVYGLSGKFKGVAFADLPFVVPASLIQGSPRDMPSLDGWPENRFPRLRKYRVTLMETGLEFCRRGQAVGYFANFVVHLHNSTVKPELRLSPVSTANRLYRDQGTSVFIAKRKSDHEDARFKKVARAIRIVCKENHGNRL